MSGRKGKKSQKGDKQPAGTSQETTKMPSTPQRTQAPRPDSGSAAPTQPSDQARTQPPPSSSQPSSGVQPPPSVSSQSAPQPGSKKKKPPTELKQQPQADLPIDKMSTLSIQDAKSQSQASLKQSGEQKLSEQVSKSSSEPTPVEQLSAGGKKKKGKGKAQPTESIPAPEPGQSAPASKPPDGQKPSEQISKPSSGPTPAEQSSEGGKKKKGKGKAQPTQPVLASGARGEPVPSTSSTGQQPTGTVASGKEMLKDLMKADDGKVWDIPKRKDQLIKHSEKYIAEKVTIEVNYLPITMKNTKLKIFHYDVDFKPDVPKYLLRDALKMMQREFFPTRNPGFDGKKNMYVAGTKLRFPQGDTVRHTVRVHNAERARDVDFDVTIKYVDQDLNLASLFDYMQRGRTSEMPQEVIQSVDIALRSNLANRFVTAGRSFFSAPTGRPVDLGGGLELWHGFYQSAIMAWKPYLNVDVANKGFPTSQSVIDYLRNVLRLTEDDLRKELHPKDQSQLVKFLKGLKVDYEVPGVQASKRTFKVIGLGKSAINHIFTITEEGKPDRSMCVAEYFQKNKRYSLRYPNLPLIWVGSPQKMTMLPAELCRITHGQAVMRKLDERQTAVMVRQAATATTIRKDRIMTNIREANYSRDGVLQEFDISVNTSFEQVDAYILKPPMIGYANQKTARVNRGVWRQDPNRFFESTSIGKWAVINTDGRCRDGRKMVQLLMQQGEQMGIQVGSPICPETQIDRANQNNLEKTLGNLKKDGVQIVVVIMSPFPHDLYNCIKRASEFTTGVLTQCIKSNTVNRFNPMTAGNLLLKMNAKLNGTNHIIPPNFLPSILNEPCMIIGADVTHPSPGSEGFPSIAAVAASHDRWGFKYNMMYRIQPSRMEMITDLEEMIKAQLMLFRKKTNQVPQRLLYFRDGVSEGQFQQLLGVEMQAIRRACAKLSSTYKPGITIVVVQKRHHTRFFPSAAVAQGDKNQNTPSGTLVDTKITHPTELDFYLVSHQSIQGTARPTKYHLLWDDNNLGDENLQILTFYLCFMFSRCTRAVSYPAPTYYAHLAAFRARAWYEGININYPSLKGMEDFKQKQESIGKINELIIDNSPMFFV